VSRCVPIKEYDACCRGYQHYSALIGNKDLIMKVGIYPSEGALPDIYQTVGAD